MNATGAHLQVIHDTGAEPENDRGDSAGGRPRVRVSTSPDAIRVLREVLAGGLIPGTYVAGGQVVIVEEVSGAAPPVSGDEDAVLPLEITPVTGPLLAGLLAEHVEVVRVRSDGGESETTPSAQVLAAVLARRTWPTLAPLRGLIGAPVLRPDGTLLQSRGYDPATGWFLAPRVVLPPVPDRPTPGQVAEARAFLLDVFLTDFPWVSASDRANYVALLVTPILRPLIRSLVPFGMVVATTPGSGKTILTSCIGLLCGQRVLTWPDDDELRKTITAIITDPGGVVVFDNLGEGQVVDSPVLARLMTDPEWSDRLLGGNRSVSAPNDKLWMATGNNLRLGGDMASRSVWVRLDPGIPHPEERTGFAIEGLDTWILDPIHQAEVLWALLVLVLDWTAAGAPTDDRTPPMRQFTRWAQTCGGFLAHHDIGGFLQNTTETREYDETAAAWRAFLLTWHHLHADKPLTAKDLRDSAHVDPTLGTDRWAGTFPTARTGPGRLPSVPELAQTLTGQIGRWREDVVLRSVINTHTKIRSYWVETREET